MRRRREQGRLGRGGGVASRVRSLSRGRREAAAPRNRGGDSMPLITPPKSFLRTPVVFTAIKGPPFIAPTFHLHGISGGGFGGISSLSPEHKHGDRGDRGRGDFTPGDESVVYKNPFSARGKGLRSSEGSKLLCSSTFGSVHSICFIKGNMKFYLAEFLWTIADPSPLFVCF